KPFDSIICSLEIHKDIQKRTINEYKEKLLEYLNQYYKNMETDNEYHFMEFKNEQDKYTHYGILLAINTIKEK
ncbi:MAG: hypothetical protein H9Q66_06840, partial [Spiroplasma ixodetis]|nr:hypothetical protein [Spiroplasma ixodetis]